MSGRSAARRRPHTSAGRRRPADDGAHGTLPAWAAPATFAAATVLLFPEFFFTGGWLLGTDTYALSYFARDFYTDFVREWGRFPVWNPLLFGGMPFVDGMHGDIFYPVSLALFFLDARVMWGWKIVMHVFLAGVFCHLWLRSIGVGRAAALFGGLVFMMGPDLVSLVYPGGDGKLFVSALAPLVFWLAEQAVQRRRAADFAWFALGIALIVFTSHMQLVYFTVWGVSLYFLFRVLQARRAGELAGGGAARLVGAYAVAGFVGAGAAAVQVIPPLQYLREWSHRTDRTVQAEARDAYAYSTSWSLHAEEIASLIVPEFAGDNAPTETRSGRTYWGRNPFKLNHEYAGLVPLLLLPLLLVGRRDPRTWFFLGLAGLALLYALGANTPAFRLFYLIPGVNLFRAPSLIIFLYGLSVATLGALAVQRLVDRKAGPGAPPGEGRVLWVGAAVFGVLAIAQSADVITNAWQAVFGVAPDRLAALEENLPRIRLGFWIAFGLAAAVAAVHEALVRGLFGARTAVLLLAALAAADLYRVDRPFIRSTVLLGRSHQGGTLFEPDPSIRFLQARQASGEVFRAYDMGPFLQGGGAVYGSNDLAAHGIEQLAGHHGNEIRRYRALVGGEVPVNAIASEFRLFDLTNTQYLLIPGRIEQPGFEEVFIGDRSIVYRKESALPRAYVVGRVEVVPDERAIERILSPDFDLAGTAILAAPLAPDIALDPDVHGTVEWTSRQADGYTLRVRTDGPGLLVVSDNYYPAWIAEVAGEAVDVVRANYTFRAVPVPAGTTEVRFVYRSGQLRATALASAGLILVLLGVGVTGLQRGRRQAGE
jgi:hypothetical protein